MGGPVSEDPRAETRIPCGHLLSVGHMGKANDRLGLCGA
jgi:hypothetical protein